MSGYGTMGGNAPAEDLYTPVNQLNPYVQGWTIKVRVTSKEQIREFTKRDKSGMGKVASISLLDSHGGEIRCTMFNQELDKFYGIMEKGKVYLISKGKIKTVQRKQFSHIKNDYQITLQRDSTVTFCQDDGQIKEMKYKFVPISSVNDLGEGKYCDIVGIVTKAGECEEIMSKKSSQTYKKRNVELADQTGRIELTLWRDDAQNGVPVGTILALKACKVSHFNSRTLGGGQVAQNPSIEEAVKISEWYKSAGGNIQVQSLTKQGGNRKDDYMTFADSNVKGATEKAEFFTVCGQVLRLPTYENRDPWYMSCPKQIQGQDRQGNAQMTKCNKKAIQGGGGWTCAHPQCAGETFDHAEPRFILRFAAADHTGESWLNCFHDVALKVLQKPSAEIVGYKNAGNTDAYEACFKDPTFQTWKFTCRAKSELYQDQLRRKVVAIRAEPVDWVSESKRLVDKIGSA